MRDNEVFFQNLPGGGIILGLSMFIFGVRALYLGDYGWDVFFGGGVGPSHVTVHLFLGGGGWFGEGPP